MAEQIEHDVGDQLEPGGRAAAPGRLVLVQHFINTWNCEFPTDRLETLRSAAAWLYESKLSRNLAEANRLQPSDLARLRELREAVRALATANVTGMCDPASLEVIRSAAAAAPMIVTIDDDRRTHIEPDCSGVDGVVATIIAILHEAQLAGDWVRLKACRQCGYAFYDRSKNRSATWCSMSICGNRSKNRAYYQRQRTSDQPPDGRTRTKEIL
ncbi:MAG: CGNR zinc finger domain-containing protein [Ilumatobacteraceae bacterium]